MKPSTNTERRSFPRINLPLYCRPARPEERKRQILDASLGGIRVYSDDFHHQGDTLQLEIFKPDGAVMKCTALVRWISSAPLGSDAQFEIGLEFIEVPGDVLTFITSFLEPV